MKDMQEFECDTERLSRLVCPDGLNGFRSQIETQYLIDGVRESELQHITFSRPHHHYNNHDALTHASKFEAAKIASRVQTQKVREVTFKENKNGDIMEVLNVLEEDCISWNKEERTKMI